MDFEMRFPHHSLEEWIEKIEKESKTSYDQLYQHYPDFSIEPAHSQMSPEAEEISRFFQSLPTISPELHAYFPYPEKDSEKTLEALLQFAQTWETTSVILDLRFSEDKQAIPSHLPILDWQLDPYIQSHLGMETFKPSYNDQNHLWILGDTWHEFNLTPAQQIKLILYAYEQIRQNTNLPVTILLATSPKFLIEIAKIRALKFLLYQQFEHIPPILVRTDFRSLARLDVHDNLIRLTLQAYAGLMGGANSLLILPYTFWANPWDLDAYRLSWNIYFLFRYESHLIEQINAVTSSYVLETLTLRLIEKVNQLSLPDSPLSWIKEKQKEAQEKIPTIIGVTKYREANHPLDPPVIQWKRIHPQPLIPTLYYEDHSISN